jgi:hypothetical protein
MIDIGTARHIDDFSVTLSDSDDGGKHIEFASANEGRLAGFPTWDHAERDLKHFTASDVPFGTREEPYVDRDDGWRIVIFSDGGWVFVGEGTDPNRDQFVSTFRISLDAYFRAWALLIDQFNPITPLDDLFEEPL